SVTNEGTSDKPGVLDVTEEESSENNKNESDSKHETNESGFEFDQEKNEKKIEDDEEEEEEEIVKTPSNDFDDEDETKVDDKADCDEYEEMDYTSSLLYDDLDIRLNEPVDTDKGFKGKVPVTSSSHSFDLAAKFLNFADILHSDAKIVSPLDVHVHYESSSSKGDKSKLKSFGKSVELEEPEFEVVDFDIPHDQEENPCNDDEEPKEKVATKLDWFTKPTQPQELTDSDWNVGKTS
nr:hypothetical protein [Tanacetum cinerariifolium]